MAKNAKTAQAAPAAAPVAAPAATEEATGSSIVDRSKYTYGTLRVRGHDGKIHYVRGVGDAVTDPARYRQRPGLGGGCCRERDEHGAVHQHGSTADGSRQPAAGGGQAGRSSGHR